MIKVIQVRFQLTSHHLLLTLKAGSTSINRDFISQVRAMYVCPKLHRRRPGIFPLCYAINLEIFSSFVVEITSLSA